MFSIFGLKPIVKKIVKLSVGDNQIAAKTLFGRKPEWYGDC